MADKTITFETEGARRAADDLRDVADASKEAGDGVRKAGEESKKAAPSADKHSKALGRLAAAYGILKEVVIDGFKENAKLEASQGRLVRSLEKLGRSSSKAADIIAEVDARSRRLGLNLVEQRENFDRLVGASESVEKALRDLALAQDIAASGDADLKEAVELLTRARKGEFEELKKLDGITKEHIEKLKEIPTAAGRAEEAIRLLSKEYSGASEELKGTSEEIDNLKEAATELTAVVGEGADSLISTLASLLGIIEPGETLFNQFARGMRNFAEDAKEAAGYLDYYRQWVDEGGFFGTGKTFTEFISEVDSRNATVAGEGGTFDVADLPRQTGGGRSGYGNQGRAQGGEGERTDPPRGPRRPRPDGSGAMVLEEADDAEIFGMLAQEEGDQRDQQALAKAREKARERADFMKQMEESNYAERQAAFRDHQKKMNEIADEAEEERLAAKMEKEQRAIEIRNSAVEAGIGVAQSAANEFVESEAAKAAISAAIEGARSIAAFAAGNIPGGIGHAAAAAQFGIVAASAGKQPPGGSTGKGAGGRQTAERQRQRDDVGLIGERARNDAEQQAPRPLTVNINSAFPPSPQQAAELASAVERDRRRQV